MHPSLSPHLSSDNVHETPSFFCTKTTGDAQGLFDREIIFLANMAWQRYSSGCLTNGLGVNVVEKHLSMP